MTIPFSTLDNLISGAGGNAFQFGGWYCFIASGRGAGCLPDDCGLTLLVILIELLCTLATGGVGPLGLKPEK